MNFKRITIITIALWVMAELLWAATVIHDDDTEFTGTKDRVYDADIGKIKRILR